MTTPAPHNVSADVARLAARASEVDEAYRWLYEDGFTGSGGRGIAPDGSANGSVPWIFAHRRVVRDKLGFAARATSRALGQLDGALAALHEIAELLDGDRPDEDEAPTTPVSVGKAERARLVLAQGRRIDRGESPPPVGKAA